MESQLSNSINQRKQLTMLRGAGAKVQSFGDIPDTQVRQSSPFKNSMKGRRVETKRVSIDGPLWVQGRGRVQNPTRH